jgi:hypothetical protein
VVPGAEAESVPDATRGPELGADSGTVLIGSGSSPDPTDDSAESRLEFVALVLLAVTGVALWLGAHKGLFHQVAPDLTGSAIVGLVLLVAYGRLLRKKSRREVGEERQLLERATSAITRIAQQTSADGEHVSQAVGEALARRLPMIAVGERLGLRDFRVDRPTGAINDAVLAAHETVHILEISLHTMRNITMDQWQNCRAGDMRFILLDPLYPASAPLALQRDSEEEQQRGQILKEVHDFLHQLPSQWFSVHDNGPRVRLAQAMPTLSYFRIDDTAYFSPLVHKQVGDATLHLQLTEGGLFFDLLAKHFDALWNDNEHVIPAERDIVPRDYPSSTSL